MNVLIYSGLLLGLSSSFHCVGMCGPIAMAIPLDRSSNVRMISGALQYNIGRIITYAILGALVGTIGISIRAIGVLQWLSIISGAFLIIFAWRKYLHKLLPSMPALSVVNKFTGKGMSAVMRSGSPFKLFFLGSINGLLPCGMVFVGLTNAVLTGNIVEGSLAMAMFGLGTLPSMFAVAFMANKLSSSFRTKMNKSVPYLLSIVGVLIMLRGMNLNIPYLSPAPHVVENVQEDGSVDTKVEMSCCHSADNCE